MTDQSLRAALEKLANDMHDHTSQRVTKEFLLELLAAHPVEPAPSSGYVRRVIADSLTALHEERTGEAAPIDFDGASRVIRDLSGLGYAITKVGAKPLLDREAVQNAIFGSVWATIDDAVAGVDDAADVVMELARPMPTQEQIEGALYRALRDGNFAEEPSIRRRRQAQALLELMKGETDA